MKIKTKNQARKHARKLNCELKYSGKNKKVYIHRLVPFKPINKK
jgi:hypothetical protein